MTMKSTLGQQTVPRHVRVHFPRAHARTRLTTHVRFEPSANNIPPSFSLPFPSSTGARAQSMPLVAAPVSEVAASRQLYKSWVASFALGYQPAHFAAELPIWAAAGVAHAPKSKIAQSSSVTLSAHASFEVMVRYLRDCYAASSPSWFTCSNRVYRG
jgi:hypothetical protein